MYSTTSPPDSRAKRKPSSSPVLKKLRSKMPRRKRFQISPILSESSNSLVPETKPAETESSSVFQATSSSSSCFPQQPPPLPSPLLPLGSEKIVKKRRSVRRKRDVVGEKDEEKTRPITRSYLKLKSEATKTTTGDHVEVELSESSCVDSSSNAASAAAEARLLSKFVSEKQAEEAASASAAALFALSEVSCVQTEIEQNVVDSTQFAAKPLNLIPEKLYSVEVEGDEASTKQFEFPNDDLTCSEHIDNSDYSTSNEAILSDLESEFFPRNSNSEFSSEFTPSLLFESGSDFSEASSDSTPAAYFSLLLQFAKQFAESNLYPDIDASSDVQDEFTLMRFAEEENEESYKKFRSRERKEIVQDYGQEYLLTTECGDLVIQQRLVMVNWIIEQSNTRELQSETMFLAISLLDRFLTRGYFGNKRKLQILGIACLTLATRIEENQPLNSIRQRAFHIEDNAYSKCEVVAMEWLVQKILNFKCFVPTTYNFLWFYLRAARADAEMERRAKYLAMLSLFDHEVLCYWPSTIAAGLVILASLAGNQDSSCQWVIETHVRTKDDDLPECIQSLEWLVKYAC